jgi:hypothetical protein
VWRDGLLCAALMLHAVSLLLLYVSFAAVAAGNLPGTKGVYSLEFWWCHKGTWVGLLYTKSLCAQPFDHLLAKRVLMMMSNSRQLGYMPLSRTQIDRQTFEDAGSHKQLQLLYNVHRIYT